MRRPLLRCVPFVLLLPLLASLAMSRGAPQEPRQEPGADVARLAAAKECYEIAVDVWNEAKEAREAGRIGFANREEEVLWSRRRADSAVASGTMTARKAYGEHLVLLEAMLESAQVLYKSGRQTTRDLMEWRYLVAEAKQLAYAAN